MRVTNAENYFEERDTISRDWSNFMINNFPNSNFLFIPNIGSKAIEFIKNWNLNVLIFSGGDDYGLTPDRDLTENELLKYALEEEIPIIGVCRGLQLIHTFFGGKITRGNREFENVHRATNHTVKINNSLYTVNSYHTNKIDEKTVDKSFKIFARSINDNEIEGLESEKILGIMWHPERKNIDSELNKLLINNFLRKNEK